MSSTAYKGVWILMALVLVGALVGACAAPAPTPTAAPTTAPAAPTAAAAPTVAAAPTKAPAPAPTTAAAPPAPKVGGEVIHMSWGGSYEENLKKIFFNTFEKETGVKVTPISPMNLAKLRAGAKAGKVELDSFDASDMELARARKENLLVPINYDLVGREGRSKLEMNEYGLGIWGTSNVLVYNTKKWPAGQGPSSWADFWDVQKFPGRRALYKHPVANLPFALMADGVPVDRLQTIDVDRAFKSLDRIKPYISVWWEQGAQSQQIFKDGEVDMMMMWNGRATDLIKQGVPLHIVWNQGVISFTHFMVAKGGPNTEGALKLAEYFGRPQLQAEWAKTMGYGPLSAKAFDYIDKDTAKTLSTYPENLKVQHVIDAEWWATNFDTINERFMAWVASK